MMLTSQEFDIIEIYHIRRAKHEVLDCLSRFTTTTYSDNKQLRELPLLKIRLENSGNAGSRYRNQKYEGKICSNVPTHQP